MEAFVEEVINETMGTSHRRWAQLVLAMTIGAVGALWLTRRTSAQEAAESPTSITPVGDLGAPGPSGPPTGAEQQQPPSGNRRWRNFDLIRPRRYVGTFKLWATPLGMRPPI